MTRLGGGIGDLADLAFPTAFIVPSKFDTSGTEGGQKQARPSFKGPAAQTFPKEIEACYRSRFKDGVLLTLDFKQSEVCWGALLSGDKSLLDALKSGTDIHAQRADEFYDFDWRKSIDPTPEKLRWGAKQTVFADFYWASAFRVQHTILSDVGILIPLSKCEAIVKRRKYLRPGLWRWQNELLAKALKDGRLELPFTGHSRYFIPGGESYEVSEIINFPVQATSAINLNYLQNYLHNSVLPPINTTRPHVRMWLNQYDSLRFDLSSPSLADDFLPQLDSAFQHLLTEGYWAWWQSLLERTCPLTYEITRSDSP